MSPELLPLPSCCHSLLKIGVLGGAGFLIRSAAQGGTSHISGLTRVGRMSPWMWQGVLFNSVERRSHCVVLVISVGRKGKEVGLSLEVVRMAAKRQESVF